MPDDRKQRNASGMKGEMKKKAKKAAAARTAGTAQKMPNTGIPAAKPPVQRPELPDFWDSRFAAGVVPWNAGGIPAEVPAFAREFHRLHRLHRPPSLYFSPEPDADGGAETNRDRAREEERERNKDADTNAAARPLRNLRILIPGCGHAYEAAYFASLGGRVTALDFSTAAVAAARAVLGAWPGELLHADFFAYAPPEPFDLIYERAFLCALPRKRWHDYARQAAALLAPGGCLAGFFLYGEEGKGPPFAAAPQTLHDLLSPYFIRVEDRASLRPLPLFTGERWQVWRRNEP